MSQPIAFDPSAEVRFNLDDRRRAEVTLQPLEDGRLLLIVDHDEDVEPLELRLRADFLQEFLAQARAREAAA